MASFLDPILTAMDSFFEFLSKSTKQTASSYIQLETADSETNLVNKDGSLLSVFKIRGIRKLVGEQEFKDITYAVQKTFANAMSQNGQTIQWLFSYDRANIKNEITQALVGARDTAKNLSLDLEDLFIEKEQVLSEYCSSELIYLTIWTKPGSLTKVQLKDAQAAKKESLKKVQVPRVKDAQSLVSAVAELRDRHSSLVNSILADLSQAGFSLSLLNVKEALHCVRMTIDPDFTSHDWMPALPGDKILPREAEKFTPVKDASTLLWPALPFQLVPRDGENIDLNICRIGDKIYAPMYITLLPQEVIIFHTLFGKSLQSNFPWRVSILLDSKGVDSLGINSMLASFLTWCGSENKLIDSATEYLREVDSSTDDKPVKIRLMFATWAQVGQDLLLKTRAAELAKTIQSWGLCEVSRITGDPYGGTFCSTLATSYNSNATATIAPFSAAVNMLPVTRPCSDWDKGAVLFRSPDGKLMPFQPGSRLQTTWIDLIYARPGAGKSVLSNALNLGLCLVDNIARLPRISIIDIGPSSLGLVSLLKEALPANQRRYVAYYRMRMTKEFSVNPFDTQLGSRFPTPQERSFLVNFLTLLATPLGDNRSYDGMSDMAALIIDEMYNEKLDKNQPNIYTQQVNEEIDELLKELKMEIDVDTSWWEVTDFLYSKGKIHPALLAQRYAVPIIADAVAISRATNVVDLFGKVVAPTQEPLIQAFTRMISSAVRQYPILSKPTIFDLGDAKIVSIDLDEVAKTGGDSADRQTAVMYMLARYILAKDYYLTPDNLSDMPEDYRPYHKERITEIREDPKRIVFDEFHRTSKAQAVRDQVIVDMREGRKWKVQIALSSQSVDDFDTIMVDFATCIYILDAGPQQAIDKATKIFGLTPTTRNALKVGVHGPRAGGGTLLGIFSTKNGVNTQLLTNTIGPVELWSFSTTAEDAEVRNRLYQKIGAQSARRVLAAMYPGGSLVASLDKKIVEMKELGTYNEGTAKELLNIMVNDLIEEFNSNPKKYKT